MSRWLFRVVCLPVLCIAARVTAIVAAEPQACSDCFLGVYDDLQMTRSSGSIGRFEIKPIYLGIRLPQGVGIRSLSFSATYPDGFTMIDYSSLVNGATFRLDGAGVTLEWPQCVVGSRVLFVLRLFTFASIRDAVLQLRSAEAAGCDSVRADRWLVPAGCYILNPTGRSGCSVGVEHATWSGMKELFK
jgi:hypothetical protein